MKINYKAIIKRDILHKMKSCNSIRRFCVAVLLLYGVILSHSGLVSCSPFSDDVDIMSRKPVENDLWEDDPTLLTVPDFAGEARIFGNFSFGNSSVLTVAGFVIVGIILFELALYALDVYYNQTYGNPPTSFDKADTVDTNSGNNLYNNLYSSTSQQSSNSIYDDYPPYYDYFHGTYRKFSPKWKNLNRILDWIQVASETYSAGTTVLNDIECQMKVICEIYRDDTNELGEVGRRAKHSLDFVDAVQYLNLPDEFLNLADEYMMAKESAKDKELDCEENYPYCPHSLTTIKKKYDALLV